MDRLIHPYIPGIEFLALIIFLIVTCNRFVGETFSWNTVEPPNKGHFGSRAFVLFSEVVLWWEVRANMQFLAPSRPNIPRQHVLKLRSRLLHRCTTELKHPEAKSVDLSTIVSSDSLPL